MSVNEIRVQFFSAGWKAMEMRKKYGEQSEEYKEAQAKTDDLREQLKKAWTERVFEQKAR